MSDSTRDLQLIVAMDGGPAVWDAELQTCPKCGDEFVCDPGFPSVFCSDACKQAALRVVEEAYAIFFSQNQQ